MFIVIFSFFCTKKEVILKESVFFNFNNMIENLENGFDFELKMKNKIMEFQAKGEYYGAGKFKMKKEIKINGRKEDIDDLNPYEVLKIVLGEKDFKYIDKRNGFYVFSFHANLFFLDPVSGICDGEIFIKDSSIYKVFCSKDELYFNMIINSKKREYNKYYIDFDGDIENLLKRLSYYGEKDIVFQNNILSFKEFNELDHKIFKKGEVKFLLLKTNYNGILKDPIDTLFSYSIICTLTLEYNNVEKLYDQKGRPNIIISIDEVIDGYIGLLIDGELVSVGLGKKIVYFPFLNEKERDIYYSIIKSGKLNGIIKNYRRLK